MPNKIDKFQHVNVHTKVINEVAIVWVNLGTPEAPTVSAVRKYLREFLSDHRVVEIPKWIWQIILQCIIVPFRSKSTAMKYQTIWTDEGSPLKVHTLKQAALLRGYLGEQGAQVEVVAAMRYGQPALSNALAQLQQQGCKRVLVVPAYPQYSGATTASIFDAVFAFYENVRNIPELRFVKHYYDHPGYIQALKKSVLHHWEKTHRAQHLVISFHGTPKRTQLLGDPYHDECQETARLLAQSLGLSTDKYSVTFQSRFGKAEWLQPYTLPTVQALAKKGVNRIDVICPGFVSDCLETLEEISVELQDAFVQAGGQQFNYIPCLNEDTAWLHGLAEIVQSHLYSWSTGADEFGEPGKIRVSSMLAK